MQKTNSLETKVCLFHIQNCRIEKTLIIQTEVLVFHELVDSQNAAVRVKIFEICKMKKMKLKKD